MKLQFKNQAFQEAAMMPLLVIPFGQIFNIHPVLAHDEHQGDLRCDDVE